MTVSRLKFEFTLENDYEASAILVLTFFIQDVDRMENYTRVIIYIYIQIVNYILVQNHFRDVCSGWPTDNSRLSMISVMAILQVVNV